MFGLKNLVHRALFGLSAALLISCSSSYHLVKSNRNDYPINENSPVDSSIVKTYLPYKAKLDEEMNQVLGQSAVLMSKIDTVPENLLRNFFSDACLEQALKIDPSIDFAMPSTKGGIRVDVPKGPIRLTNIFELMPFENELIVFKLKGTDVEELLNFIASTGGQPIAGFRMKIKNGKAADVFIGGKAFDVNREYRVLTSDYIAGGGDRVESFKHPLDKRVLNLRVRDALINSVKQATAKGQTINPKLDGRITKD